VDTPFWVSFLLIENLIFVFCRIMHSHEMSYCVVSSAANAGKYIVLEN
jgi:hypothetical protein